MIITVASGKGGTGKTLIATSLALSLGNENKVQIVDCDVEEPNTHILLEPTFDRMISVSVPIPEVNNIQCTYCGDCSRICAFNAIAVLPEKVLIFPELCHGCGACAYFCPENALVETNRKVGSIQIGYTGKIHFVQGQLKIGETMATPVIRAVKEYINHKHIVIVDASPGTACPVVETVKGSDFCLLVTEPTPFGFHDLLLAMDMVKRLGIPFGVVINRCKDNDNEVEKFCLDRQIPVLLRIPLDIEIARLYAKGVTLVSGIPRWQKYFRDLLSDIKQLSLHNVGVSG